MSVGLLPLRRRCNRKLREHKKAPIGTLALRQSYFFELVALSIFGTVILEHPSVMFSQPPDSAEFKRSGT